MNESAPTTEELIAQGHAVEESAAVSKVQVPASKPKAHDACSATSDPDVWWSTCNAMTMSSVVLAFGFVVLLLAAWLMVKKHAAIDVLRVFGTVLVIVMVTFLVVAGYDDKQIAAPLGLLRTIVGYLLGRDANSTGPDGKKAPSTMGKTEDLSDASEGHDG